MYPLFFVRYITSKDQTDCRWEDGPSFKPRCTLITALYSQINGHRFHSKGEPPGWTVHVPELKVPTKFRNLNSIHFIQSSSGPHIQSLTIFSKQKILSFIDRMHKWWPKKYSYVFVLISLTSLVSTDEVQKKTSFRTRLVALINTKTKEY